MIVTIKKLNRTLKEGVSKKTGKPYSFESLGIVPVEENLMDINGDEFQRAERWLSGVSKVGVTDTWSEGDRVKIILVRAKVTAKDGSPKEVINFKLPDGVDPMVAKFNSVSEAVDPSDDF